jgi:branched-chain amino acid transport system permease protein
LTDEYASHCGNATSNEKGFILIVSIIIMVVLSLFIKFTNLGKAMRATSQDRVMASLLGIDVNKVIAVTFLIGSGIAAMGSILISQYVGQINFSMGFLIGIKAFVAAVLGGIGSIPGALLGDRYNENNQLLFIKYSFYTYDIPAFWKYFWKGQKICCLCKLNKIL